MTLADERLFPPDYWRETQEHPRLRIVHRSDLDSFRIMRCYVGQEGSLVIRQIEETFDQATAIASFSELNRDLERMNRMLPAAE